MAEELREKESIAEKIIGNWDASCVYNLPDVSVKRVKSEITIEKGKFVIYISGIYEIGETKAHWKVRKVFLDDKQLSYVFDVPFGGPGRSLLGLTVLDLIDEDSNKEKIISMQGNFGVIGSKITGTAEFKRAK